MTPLKRTSRYLEGKARVVHLISLGDYAPTLSNVYVDSDLAGWRRPRKSTSCGAMMFGGIMLRGWSATQATVALSSGEAEYYMAIKGASMGQGLMACDLGMALKVVVRTDSSAARGIISSRRLGKARRLVRQATCAYRASLLVKD